MKYGIFGIAGLTSCIMATQAIADQMHYRNIIIGERAQGLAGAYVGVADDASGVYYNPAGLAFAQSNDISGSANAFYAKKAVYKNALGKDDFIEESGGTFAPFFGAMQKLDKYVPGLVGGFAYFTTDTELRDQENTIQNKYGYIRYHRSANERAATYTAAGALGYRVSTTLGLGLGLGYLKVDELLQLSENGVAENYYLLTSLRRSLVAHGAVASFGVQWAPSSKVALGFTAKSGMYASQKLNQVTDKLELSVKNGIQSDPRISLSSNPLGSMPMEIRGGVAWFASPRYLLTADFDWHEAIDDMSSNARNVYKREAVLNYSIGSEYYVTPSLPIRAGFFTNYDATVTPTGVSPGYPRPDHIDYMGATLFLALAQPTSQLSAGAVFQQGTGKAEKSTLGVLQDVEATAYTLAFSATHSF